MEHAFYTLQDFLLHTKGVTYILMGAGLVFYLVFMLYLRGDEDKGILD